MWESWEGVDADGMAHDSLNHYSKGAVVSFLHQFRAGIQQVDGSPATAGSGWPPSHRAAA